MYIYMFTLLVTPRYMYVHMYSLTQSGFLLYLDIAYAHILYAHAHVHVHVHVHTHTHTHTHTKTHHSVIAIDSDIPKIMNTHMYMYIANKMQITQNINGSDVQAFMCVYVHVHVYRCMYKCVYMCVCEETENRVRRPPQVYLHWSCSHLGL